MTPSEKPFAASLSPRQKPFNWLLVKPAFGQPISAICVSPAPFAYFTHWSSGRRERLCDGRERCADCRAGARQLWHAVIAALCLPRHTRCILRISENAAHAYRASLFREPPPDWRGLKVTQELLWESRCARQVLRVQEHDLMGLDEYDPPELAAWVERLYSAPSRSLNSAPLAPPAEPL